MFPEVSGVFSGSHGVSQNHRELKEDSMALEGTRGCFRVSGVSGDLRGFRLVSWIIGGSQEDSVLFQLGFSYSQEDSEGFQGVS